MPVTNTLLPFKWSSARLSMCSFDIKFFVNKIGDFLSPSLSILFSRHKYRHLFHIWNTKNIKKFIRKPTFWHSEASCRWDKQFSILEKMKSRTIKVIITLVALLFLNIEAAQAGLIHKLKIYIRHEFADFQLLYLVVGLLVTGFLGYIIFTPVLIGNQKWSWLNYSSFPPSRNNYSSKKDSIAKISQILNNPTGKKKEVTF